MSTATLEAGRLDKPLVGVPLLPEVADVTALGMRSPTLASRYVAVMAILSFIASVLLVSYHASSVGHVRDTRGRLVHTVRIDRPGQTDRPSCNPSQTQVSDTDECIVLGGQPISQHTKPLGAVAERTSIANALPRPRARRRVTGALYRQAPKTSPPDVR
jgi:hypothetical protein